MRKWVVRRLGFRWVELLLPALFIPQMALALDVVVDSQVLLLLLNQLRVVLYDGVGVGFGHVSDEVHKQLVNLALVVVALHLAGHARVTFVLFEHLADGGVQPLLLVVGEHLPAVLQGRFEAPARQLVDLFQLL